MHWGICGTAFALVGWSAHTVQRLRAAPSWIAAAADDGWVVFGGTVGAPSSFILAARGAVNSAEFAKANCELLRKRLTLTEGQLRAVLVAYPPVLGYSYVANIEPSLAALQSRLGLTESQLRRVVLKKPQVLGYSYEANVNPTLTKLQARLQLSEAQLTAVVVGMPSVLSYSYEAKVSPALDKLQARLGMDIDALRAVVVLYPAVLGYSYEVRHSLVDPRTQ